MTKHNHTGHSFRFVPYFRPLQSNGLNYQTREAPNLGSLGRRRRPGRGRGRLMLLTMPLRMRSSRAQLGPPEASNVCHHHHGRRRPVGQSASQRTLSGGRLGQSEVAQRRLIGYVTSSSSLPAATAPKRRRTANAAARSPLDPPT